MIHETMRDCGWRPDVPDRRDYSLNHDTVVSLLSQLPQNGASSGKLPRKVDLRQYCGPIQDQGALATGAVHACLALIQQFERQASGRLLLLSRLFLDYTTRRLSFDGPQSLSLRMTLKAAVRCGIPPEIYLPYGPVRDCGDPDAFLYSFQRDFAAIRYVRLDGPPARETLARLKAFLAAGFSMAFGFSVYTSLGEDPEIPFPTDADRLLGGHAMTAVGYDDQVRIRSHRGALLVRNSWGTDWGDRGFGWLPYAYVEQRLAADFWTLLNPAWLKSGEFALPGMDHE